MKYYNIQKSKIVYETLNTEVVIVDFNTGNYYALLHIARHIWQFLDQNVSIDCIAEVLSSHFKREITEVTADVQQFIEQLLEEGLIALADEPSRSKVTPSVESQGWEYEPPKLLKYTDVQNLLLLDPIHEVAETGWPHQK